jgi:hypothetical protein
MKALSGLPLTKLAMRQEHPSPVAPSQTRTVARLAHPVLVSDEWRRSKRQERGGAHAVEGAIAVPTRECASS